MDVDRDDEGEYTVGLVHYVSPKDRGKKCSLCPQRASHTYRAGRYLWQFLCDTHAFDVHVLHTLRSK